jgi:predicted ATP-grasp superfamily ATP-dependent carboligase
VCATVVERFGLRGAFGVDAIWDGRHAWVLEVNPRPPASLELFGPGTFAAHVRGARGLPVEWSRAPSGGKVKLVLYADRDLRAPDPTWWPSELVHDVPAAGQPLRCGAPVCTLVSAEAGAPEIAARGARLLAALPDAVLAGA